MKKAITLSLSVLALSISADSANAASLNGFDYFTTSSIGASTPDGLKTSVTGATTIDFNAPGVGAPSTGFAKYSPSGISQLFTGSKSGVSATPYLDTTRYLTLNTNQSTTIAFDGLVNYFGLYWGSVDSYNKIEFKKDNTTLATFTGTDVAKLVSATYSKNPQYASWTSPYTNVYVDFFSGSADKNFNKVVLSSTGAAFESDNHAYKPVPVPGMILGIFAAAGGLALKRKQKGTVKA
jgi:hypothetical protein